MKETVQPETRIFAVQYHIVQSRFHLTTGLVALASFLLGNPSAPADTTKRLARVGVPVADLRGRPVPASHSLEHDPLEESQLLYGDPVEILEEKDGWARVSAIDQLEFSHNQRWEGYPGWIESADLVADPSGWEPNLVVTTKRGIVRTHPSMEAPVQLVLSLGTHLVGTPQGDWWKLQLLDGTEGWIRSDEVTPGVRHHTIFKKVTSVSDTTLRQRLVETARLFLGDPYYWGGRSAKAVDCSGLVGLVYQANGIPTPRDAHEQWMKARPITQDQLQPGDLVFLADPQDTQRITHVMLYIGRNRVIEGPGTGKRVREIDLALRLKEAEGREISFGTYLE